MRRGGFDVFVRNWWRRDEHGKLIPHPGAPRRYLARGVTEAEARAMCAEYRANNEPGPLSRKAEYQSA